MKSSIGEGDICPDNRQNFTRVVTIALVKLHDAVSVAFHLGSAGNQRHDIEEGFAELLCISVLNTEEIKGFGFLWKAWAVEEQKVREGYKSKKGKNVLNISLNIVQDFFSSLYGVDVVLRGYRCAVKVGSHCCAVAFCVSQAGLYSMSSPN